MNKLDDIRKSNYDDVENDNYQNNSGLCISRHVALKIGQEVLILRFRLEYDSNL